MSKEITLGTCGRFPGETPISIKNLVEFQGNLNISRVLRRAVKTRVFDFLKYRNNMEHYEKNCLTVPTCTYLAY